MKALYLLLALFFTFNLSAVPPEEEHELPLTRFNPLSGQHEEIRRHQNGEQQAHVNPLSGNLNYRQEHCTTCAIENYRNSPDRGVRTSRCYFGCGGGFCGKSGCCNADHTRAMAGLVVKVTSLAKVVLNRG